MLFSIIILIIVLTVVIMFRDQEIKESVRRVVCMLFGTMSPFSPSKKKQKNADLLHVRGETSMKDKGSKAGRANTHVMSKIRAADKEKLGRGITDKLTIEEKGMIEKLIEEGIVDTELNLSPDFTCDMEDRSHQWYRVEKSTADDIFVVVNVKNKEINPVTEYYVSDCRNMALVTAENKCGVVTSVSYMGYKVDITVPHVYMVVSGRIKNMLCINPQVMGTKNITGVKAFRAKQNETFDLVTIEVNTGNKKILRGQITQPVYLVLNPHYRRVFDTAFIMIRMRDTRQYILSGCVMKVAGFIYVINMVLDENDFDGLVIAFKLSNHDKHIHISTSEW